MKTKNLFAAFCIMMFAAGCMNEEDFDTQNNSSSDNTSAKDGYVKLELSTQERPVGKTVIAGSQVVWEADDKISVFAGDNKNTNYEFSLKTSELSAATFEGEVLVEDADAESFVVAYPYNADVTLAGTVLSGVEIKAEQTLSAGSFGSGENLSVGIGGKTSLEFKNLGALIRVPVYGPVAVKQIIITAPEGTALAGKGTVDVTSENLDLTISDGATNVVTLTAETAIDATTGVDFFAVVAPQGPDFTCDIKVVLENGSSMTQKFEDAEVVRAKARKANDYIDRGTIVYYGNANCYIAKPGETVEIDVTPRYMSGYETCAPTDHDAFTKDIASADVVWKEVGLTGELTAVLEDGKLKVGGIAGAGNALVAIKDADGIILWSYHIWVPKSDPTQTLTYKMHSSYTLAATEEMMPMNLGAMDKTGADAYGLYYQWGRKDPLGRWDVVNKKYVECGIDWTSWIAMAWFLNSTNAQYPNYGAYCDCVQGGIRYPHKFLATGGTQGYRGNGVDISGFWGNHSTSNNNTNSVKSVFDPCPQGYRVPQRGVFANFVNESYTGNGITANNVTIAVSNVKITNSSSAKADYGYYIKYNDGDEVDFYPFSGQANCENASLGTTAGASCTLWYSTPGSAMGIYGGNFVANSNTSIIMLNQTQVHQAYGRGVRCVKE